MLSPIIVSGTELHFRNSEGDRYAYEGTVETSVELTKNFGILGENFYYEDEGGTVRTIESKQLESSGRKPGYITVDGSEARMIYIDEFGNKNALLGATSVSE